MNETLSVDQIDDAGVSPAADTAMTTAAIVEPEFYRYVSVPPALFSACCSIFVIYHSTIVTLQKKTFHRLLVMLCAFDILSSTTLALEPFTTISSPPGHWTCDTSGFVKVLGVTCGSTYNAALSFFYYVVICRGWKDEYIACRLELMVHMFVVVWSGYLAFGIYLGVYNAAVSSGCWSTPYPSGCQEGECIRGEPWAWIYDTSTTVGFLTVVSILITTNTAIYCKVRRQERSNRRFDVQGSHTAGN